MSAVEKVLVVDDDEDLREAVGDLLFVAGVRQCLAVASLHELTRRAADALPSGFALIDVNLGIGCPTGVDVSRWLRNHGYTAPIVFITGHARNDPRVVAALQVPNTRLLLKPFTFEALTGLLGRS